MTSEPSRDCQSFDLQLAGRPASITVARRELAELHVPLLQQLHQDANDRRQRQIVFLAGPPGAGKSTLAALWEELARTGRLDFGVQALPMDGFHFPNHLLDTRSIVRNGQRFPLRALKGSPETFDVARLSAALAALQRGERTDWPAYDRRIHDPVERAISVANHGLLVVEGNYLLLDESPWHDLPAIAQATVFVECDEALLRDDVIARLALGGRSLEEAAQQYAFNDHQNFRRVMDARWPADITLRVGPGRTLHRAEPFPTAR